MRVPALRCQGEPDIDGHIDKPHVSYDPARSFRLKAYAHRRRLRVPAHLGGRPFDGVYTRLTCLRRLAPAGDPTRPPGMKWLQRATWAMSAICFAAHAAFTRLDTATAPGADHSPRALSGGAAASCRLPFGGFSAGVLRGAHRGAGEVQPRAVREETAEGLPTHRRRAPCRVRRGPSAPRRLHEGARRRLFHLARRRGGRLDVCPGIRGRRLEGRSRRPDPRLAQRPAPERVCGSDVRTRIRLAGAARRPAPERPDQPPK